MKQKLLFFDIDGTILNKEKKIPKSTKDALKTLQNSGHYLAIATGRSPFMFKEIKDELKISSFVSFNGQYVVLDDEPIYKNPHDKVKLKELLNTSKSEGHPLIFMDHIKMKATADNHPHIHESLGTLHFNHPEVDEEYYIENDVYQTLLFCERKHEDAYLNSYPHFHFIRWHELSTDVLPRGGSKAKGIEAMMKKLGFSREDVVAFGDGLNDIEMLQFAGTGVTMGNGVKQAKEVASFVTKSVEDDGILYGLQQLKLL
ncbi:Cof-type HAD-IIB family hydrolase [Bacillus suaedaesalsae]|uniref:Cof-type HAD-IIB family hydrolase n=1 Tax=Bacillus suaedaesalsae TaxID=2810349 RepID=A0ABS2DJ68_9BACI|nr:Cof-type HAD-IIB family hydrolase [Bacillus suaedaesalsae]MBM6617606.1 Cof-type HAD-IIB family hydrolase [Bacillus suaedaesalsae]